MCRPVAVTTIPGRGRALANHLARGKWATAGATVYVSAGFTTSS